MSTSEIQCAINKKFIKKEFLKRGKRKLPKTTEKCPQIKRYDPSKQKRPIKYQQMKKKKDIYTKAEYHKICEHQGKENHKNFQREIRMPLDFLIVTLDAFKRKVCVGRGGITWFNSKQCFYNQRMQI